MVDDGLGCVDTSEATQPHAPADVHVLAVHEDRLVEHLPVLAHAIKGSAALEGSPGAGGPHHLLAIVLVAIRTPDAPVAR